MIKQSHSDDRTVYNHIKML